DRSIGIARDHPRQPAARKLRIGGLRVVAIAEPAAGPESRLEPDRVAAFVAVAPVRIEQHAHDQEGADHDQPVLYVQIHRLLAFPIAALAPARGTRLTG